MANGEKYLLLRFRGKLPQKSYPALSGIMGDYGTGYLKCIVNIMFYQLLLITGFAEILLSIAGTQTQMEYFLN